MHFYRSLNPIPSMSAQTLMQDSSILKYSSTKPLSDTCGVRIHTNNTMSRQATTWDWLSCVMERLRKDSNSSKVFKHYGRPTMVLRMDQAISMKAGTLLPSPPPEPSQNWLTRPYHQQVLASSTLPQLAQTVHQKNHHSDSVLRLTV